MVNFATMPSLTSLDSKLLITSENCFPSTLQESAPTVGFAGQAYPACPERNHTVKEVGLSTWVLFSLEPLIIFL